MGKAASAKSIQAHSFRSSPEPDRITRAGTIDDVCFGSIADLFGKFSLMSASERKADIGFRIQSPVWLKYCCAKHLNRFM